MKHLQAKPAESYPGDNGKSGINGGLLTADQVADLLGVPKSWVYEQSRAGRIPTVNLGRYRRYRREAIEQWWRGSRRRQREPVPAPEHRCADEAILRSLRRARTRQVARPMSSPDNAGMARRAYGSGSLSPKQLSSGEEVWVGQWYDAAGRHVKRRVGPKRDVGEKNGLTKTQAERELRKLIDSHVATASAERMTVGQAGERYVESRAALGRSPTTIEDYGSIIRVHFDPYFGAMSIDRVTERDVEQYMAQKRGEGRSLKSVSNDLALLSSISAMRHGAAGEPAPGTRSKGWSARGCRGVHSSSSSSTNPSSTRCCEAASTRRSAARTA